MEIVLLSAMTALGFKVVDFLKYLRAKDMNAVVTQAAAWAAGVAVVFLGGATDFASSVDINGFTLQALNGASKVLLGTALLSVAGVAFDFKKSIDGTDSAKTPTLTGS